MRSQHVAIMLASLAFSLVIFMPYSQMSWAISVREAVIFSLQKYPGLAAERNLLKSAEKDVGIITSMHFPTFTFESQYIRTDSPADVFGLKLSREELSADDFAGLPGTFNNPPSFDTFVTSFNLHLPLFLPGVLASRQASKRNYFSETYRYEREAEAHAMRVIEIYVGGITSRALREAAESGVIEASEHLNVAREREKAGVGIYADVLRAEVFLAQAMEKKIVAQNGEEFALEALRVAMGAGEEYPIEVEDDLELNEELLPLSVYVESALAKRSDLRMMEEKEKMAAYGLKRMRSQYLPDLSLFGSYELNGSGSPFDVDAENYKMGVLLKWDIFDGLGRERKVMKAKYQREQVREQQRNLENNVRFAVKISYLDVLAARSRYEIAKRAEERAREGLRLMEGRFRNSLSRLVELLDVQSALDGARAQKIKAANDYYLSLKELHFSSGNLLGSIGIGENPEVSQ